MVTITMWRLLRPMLSAMLLSRASWSLLTGWFPRWPDEDTPLSMVHLWSGGLRLNTGMNTWWWDIAILHMTWLILPCIPQRIRSQNIIVLKTWTRTRTVNLVRSIGRGHRLQALPDASWISLPAALAARWPSGRQVAGKTKATTLWPPLLWQKSTRSCGTTG